MKVFSANQIQEWDNFTITNEPIDSFQLMQRASDVFYNYFHQNLVQKWDNSEKTLHFFCGNGNNGGDGFCIANHFIIGHQKVVIYTLKSGKKSVDNQRAMSSVLSGHCTIIELDENENWEVHLDRINPNDIIVDAILGSGLNREIDDFFEKLFFKINKTKATVVSVDVPSGLFCDKKTTHETINAHHTFTFQTPKLAFFFPENQDRVGEWTILEIGLHRDFLKNEATNQYYITKEIIKQIYTPRKKFDHKGTFGASLMIGGSYGKMGAIALATRACLRAGAGLLTAYIPKIGYDILQISVPEAMILTDTNVWNIADVPNVKPYRAIGVGMGMSTSRESVLAFEKLIETAQQPLVIDADALNILSFRQDLMHSLPENSVLTPHVKEFERIFGECASDWERFEKAKEKAIEYQVVIVLKGAHSCIAAPDGNCYFNTTGNPGMATGGSGDVLAGILTSLIAQGYPSLEATILGVYLHGLAGDFAAKKRSQEAMTAGDIVEFLGKAYKAVASY